MFTAGLLAQGCASLNGTSWTLSYMDGRPLESEQKITIHFDNDRIHGSDGCNRYSAPVTVKRGKFSIRGNITTTMMACPEFTMQQADAFTSTLKRSVAYRIDGDRLSLLDANGRDLAVFVRKNSELGAATWLATGYNNGQQAVVSLIRDTEITAVFGADGRLSGFAGCNRYISTYTVSANSIRIGPAAATRKSCAEPPGLMEQERMFLHALETADTYDIRGDRLELRTTDGALAVTFVLSNAAPAEDNHITP